MKDLFDAIRASRTTYAILAAGLGLVALLVLLHGVNKLILGDAHFLALDKDHNLPSWTTTAVFVAAGLACGLLTWLRSYARLPIALLGTLALLLSLEQMAQIHTQVEEDLGDAATMVLQPLMAIGLVGVVAWAARGLPALSRVLLWAAIAAIAVAQGSSLVNSELDLPHAGVVLFQTIEEVGELLTGFLLIAAMAQPVLDASVARVLAGRREEQSGRTSAPV